MVLPGLCLSEVPPLRVGCLGLVHWDDPEGWCIQGGRWEGRSGWRARVHPWQIHVDVWQNQYNIVK